MDGTTWRILRTVAKRGEIPLDQALAMANNRHKDHTRQYPLALLLEGDYIGMTISHSPPRGAERMREFSLATTLHMFTLTKDAQGVVEYLGITSTGNLNPHTEKVFVKAKGALYVDEQSVKKRERVYSFIVGILVGIVVSVFSAWVRM